MSALSRSICSSLGFYTIWVRRAQHASSEREEKQLALTPAVKETLVVGEREKLAFQWGVRFLAVLKAGDQISIPAFPSIMLKMCLSITPYHSSRTYSSFFLTLSTHHGSRRHSPRSSLVDASTPTVCVSMLSQRAQQREARMLSKHGELTIVDYTTCLEECAAE